MEEGTPLIESDMAKAIDVACRYTAKLASNQVGQMISEQDRQAAIAWSKLVGEMVYSMTHGGRSAPGDGKPTSLSQIQARR